MIRKHAPATLHPPVSYSPGAGVVEKRPGEYINGQCASRSESGRLNSNFCPNVSSGTDRLPTNAGSLADDSSA